MIRIARNKLHARLIKMFHPDDEVYTMKEIMAEYPIEIDMDSSMPKEEL